MAYNIVGLPISYARSNAQWIDRSQRGPQVLWRPKDPEKTHMSVYRRHVNKKFGQNLKNTHDLHQWSVQHPHDFWIDLYDYTSCFPPLPEGTKYAYDPKAKFRDIPTWFDGHKLNFAENLLVPNVRRNPDATALIGLREGKIDDPEYITWGELYELVRITRAALIHHGLKQDDVVAALMSNSIWIFVIFLSTASIGAIFTSISPDMGLSGCLSRLAQVTPKLLFVDTDYNIRGEQKSLLSKAKDILGGLPKSQPKPKTIFVPITQKPHLQHHNTINPTIPASLGICLSTFLSPTSKSTDALTFNRVPTSAPLFIVYSSGTSGPPKCIVSPHISLLNYRKIAHLHNSLSYESTIFQYSSTSWILWNVTLGHMTVGATIVTFDGNPLYPDAGTPLEICEKYKATYWGTSPRFLLELEQQTTSLRLTRRYNLSSLRMVTTTGAPLLPSQSYFFYSPLFPITLDSPTTDIHLSSVAGGTDIASSWCASDPAGPLRLNEMQTWALGHDCAILHPEPATQRTETKWDHTSKSRKRLQKFTYREVKPNESGELICRKPLPSAPVSFWRDDEKNSAYMDAYFNRFPTVVDSATGEAEEYLDVWAQHDLTVQNPVTLGLQILGRSDTTLNPSGIRFGSSEIYHVIEAPPLNGLISDSLCVGRRRKGDSDEVVFLFVIPANGVSFDESLVQNVREAIKTNLSPRHVPKFMFQVKEIPYTINGKKVEGVVKKIISGMDVTPSSTITNPGCLDEYKKYVKVEREVSGRSRL